MPKSPGAVREENGLGGLLKCFLYIYSIEERWLWA